MKNQKKFDLTGKNALVTGGGSGIGRAISLTLAKAGAYVGILDLNTDNAKTVVEEIQTAGGNALSVACNVTNQEDVSKGFNRVLGGSSLDILVNNAGIAHVGNVENTEEKDFDQVMQVNVKGVYNTLQAGIKSMKSKGGAIVNICSVAAHVGINDRFAYSTSKGAVYAMTLSVAKDYVNEKIRCNSISPARVHTPFVDGFLAKNYPGKEKEMFDALSKTQPIGRMGQPDEIGDLVLYLCSDEASFITGTDFKIDGGFISLNT